MTSENHNRLWRDFPKTALEFDERFATEEDVSSFWTCPVFAAHELSASG